jgi:divalent metal cation (Fe/Co/Zn/Cd) transporter
MSLDEAHALASEIEANLKKQLGNVDATIHIEPSEEETEMEQLVKKLATVDGVREVHDVSTVHAGGQLYITLHAYVDPHLSVEEAHEIAEKIENSMHEGIKQLENVTVHVEPYGAEAHAGEIDENALSNIIQKLVKAAEPEFYVKRTMTYSADGKQYVNLDCCFTKKVSIKEAHSVASRIEQEIKERFTNTVVTVHIEPEQ